jgi:NADP-dependent 3-hydroxy acid dehydrogenase YdfG
MLDLAGAVFIVTGASRGIGAATAVALGGAGARVVLLARSADDLDAVAAQVRAAGGDALAVVGDAASTVDLDRVYDAAVDSFGRLDGVVNNAGRGIFGHVVDAAVADWRAMLELNLFGLMYSCQRAARVFTSQGAGTIVNVSSIGAHRVYPGFAVYHATKFGVNGFTEALRLELLPAGVRVLLIEPGATATSWGEKMPQGGARGAVELSAAQVADAIVYAVAQPPEVSISSVVVRPTGQR